MKPNTTTYLHSKTHDERCADTEMVDLTMAVCAHLSNYSVYSDDLVTNRKK